MTPVIRMVAGAHLYGTDTVSSDTDLNGVFLPDARDILLQSCRDVVVQQRKKHHGERNQPGDIDETGFALHRFLDFLGQGQIVALDMIFTPSQFWLEKPHPVWHRIVENRRNLIGLNAASFLKYCRAHAVRLGARGTRLSELTRMVDFIDSARSEHGASTRLDDLGSSLPDFIAASGFSHIAIVPLDQPDPRRAVAHLDCAGRKMPLRTRLNDAQALLARAVASYGDRAAAAGTGHDWKGLSHALRVSYQTRELLGTGHITFPRPEAALLRAIKCGERNAEETGAQLEALMAEIEGLTETTQFLRTEPDGALRDSLVCDSYAEIINAQRDRGFVHPQGQTASARR
ncbi:DNA polymerase beta superfamily protein [Asaia sp. VD9]|uniref:DNA polymerase beta superfamily protein n=1 Tax=Asaia sp. VD9 TaxID=3081235 RepID=UPI00301AAD3A